MSYPKKLSEAAILEAATACVETQGLDALSMRTLATDLGVTPNALYRYFPSKAALALALAEQAGQQLFSELQAAAMDLPLPLALRATAHAYLRFAQAHPQLYALKMQHVRCDAERTRSHQQIWDFVLQLSSQLPTPHDPRDLALSLWAGLHGLVELHRSDQLEGRDPQHTLDVMLDVTVAGLMSRLGGAARS